MLRGKLYEALLRRDGLLSERKLSHVVVRYHCTHGINVRRVLGVSYKQSVEPKHYLLLLSFLRLIAL